MAAFKTAVVVERLAREPLGENPSRLTMRRIADGEEYTTPPTIDDPVILEEIEAALNQVWCAMRASASSV